MASLKSRIIIGLLRRSHLFQGKWKRPPFDSSAKGIREFRQKTEKASTMFGKLPAGIEVHPENVGEMYAEWIMKDGAPANKAILYFHGGMYVIGSPQSHRTHVSKFVDGSGINAFVFDYRLAPENPFPAGLEDALKAYNHLLEKGFKPSNIVFAGDSAGGGLCLASLLSLKEKNKALPAAAVVLSPWTDLLLSGESYRINAKTCLSPEGSAEESSRMYAVNNDKSNPLISPIYGDLKGLPPLHISVGSKEILRDDSLRFAENARKSNVDVRLLFGEGMCHCYPVFGSMLKESKMAMADICAFINSKLND